MTLPHPVRLLVFVLALTLSACAELPRLGDWSAHPAAAAETRLDDAAISHVLRDTTTSPGPALQTQTARLLALGRRRTASEQLQLAMLLLTRGEPGDAETAQNLLDGLAARATDAPARNFIALLQRDGAQQLALQQAQKTAQSLQKQIEQIKSLETQLQNRTR
jgi:hypothetical protein